MFYYEKMTPASLTLYVKRSKLWATFPYPCIGRWRFLYLVDTRNPTFQEVLGRLQNEASNETLLDVGCCVGQVVRQMASEGVDGSRLYGTDLRRDFIDLGYELFNDKESLKATFVVGDMLDPVDKSLLQLDGKITIISASAFFHLFSWDDQMKVAERMVRFLKPGTRDGIIYGLHLGSVKPGTGKAETGEARLAYLHNQESFQRFWDEVGSRTSTRWRVGMQLIEPHLVQGMLPRYGTDEDIRAAKYAVHQIR